MEKNLELREQSEGLARRAKRFPPEPRDTPREIALGIMVLSIVVAAICCLVRCCG